MQHTAKDYFGNIVEIGDIIVRPVYGWVEETQVVDISSKHIYLANGQSSWIGMRRVYDTSINSEKVLKQIKRISKKEWEYRIFNKSKLIKND